MSEPYSYWEYQPNVWSDPCIEVSMHAGGAVFAVSEEKAMDSYNQEFTCEITIPTDKLVELRDAISAHLDKIGEPKPRPRSEGQ